LSVVVVPETDIARVADAHERFLGAVRDLSDEHVRRRSLLPGWTVGHVLTHVARNADSHVRRAEAAVRGEVVDQYHGGLAGREADIEAGAGRSAVEILDDVRRSARAVDDAWRALPADAWTARSRDANGRERPLFELPARRWQEVEVHVVDIDVGVTHRDWPEAFVLEWLPRTRERMWDRLPSQPIGLGFDDPRDELAWLYGRLRRDDLPQLPPWG
jgi:maleylpyruvate isomerase